MLHCWKLLGLWFAARRGRRRFSGALSDQRSRHSVANHANPGPETRGIVLTSMRPQLRRGKGSLDQESHPQRSASMRPQLFAADNAETKRCPLTSVSVASIRSREKPQDRQRSHAPAFSAISGSYAVPLTAAFVLVRRIDSMSSRR